MHTILSIVWNIKVAMNVYSCTGYLEWVTEDRGSRAYAEESLHRHKACFFPVPCEQSVPCEKRGQVDKIRIWKEVFWPSSTCKDVITTEVRERGRETKRECLWLWNCVCVPTTRTHVNSVQKKRGAWPWSDYVALRDRMTILFHFQLHYEMWNLASSKHRQVAASTLPASLACFDALLYYLVSCAYATFWSKDPCNRCRQNLNPKPSAPKSCQKAG